MPSDVKGMVATDGTWRREIRLATWNVWWRFGEWRNRQPAVRHVLDELNADVVGLQETWTSQVEEFAQALGYHHASCAVPAATHWHRRLPGEAHADVSNAVLSRWPIADVRTIVLSDSDAADGRTALLVRIDAPQGPMEFCCTQLSSTVRDGSALRSEQVNRLVSWLAGIDTDPAPLRVIAGDLNADPDSDEMRRLGGYKTVPFAPGEVWVDAWRFRDDHDPGYTWRRDNPHVRVSREPWARIDYLLFSVLPHGLPLINAVDLFAVEPVHGVHASDHAGVVAAIEYGSDGISG